MAAEGEERKTFKVIGAGFGRTGTMSLKAALEQLGFGPCYHMTEMFKHKHASVWYEFATGESNDWERAIGGYQSGVDFPLCLFYKDLLDAYPDSKVILSTRDPEAWYQSCWDTTFKLSWSGHPAVTFPMWVAQKVFMRNFQRMNKACASRRKFDPSMDKERVIQAFKDHEEEVKRTVPPDRLLVYSVKEGWEPLCAFLGVPVPDEAFPRVNDTNDFHHRLHRLHVMGNTAIAVGTGLLAVVAALLVYLL